MSDDREPYPAYNSMAGLRAGPTMETRSPDRPTLLTMITMVDAELDTTQNLVLGLASRLEAFRFPSPARATSSAVRDEAPLPPPAIARLGQHYHRLGDINNLLRDVLDTLALE